MCSCSFLEKELHVHALTKPHLQCSSWPSSTVSRAQRCTQLAPIERWIHHVYIPTMLRLPPLCKAVDFGALVAASIQSCPPSQCQVIS